VSLAKVMAAFTDIVRLKQYAMYTFDYGTPVGLRMALEYPNHITAIISQNARMCGPVYICIRSCRVLRGVVAGCVGSTSLWRRQWSNGRTFPACIGMMHPPADGVH
jgi:pimeloyl-ACP methyl ester carboxylesterase